jgi:hypothetical protein
LGYRVSFETVVDEGSVPTEALDGIDPLCNEDRGQDDKGSGLEVGHNETDGEDGLTEAHFVANEPASFGG